MEYEVNIKECILIQLTKKESILEFLQYLTHEAIFPKVTLICSPYYFEGVFYNRDKEKVKGFFDGKISE